MLADARDAPQPWTTHDIVSWRRVDRRRRACPSATAQAATVELKSDGTLTVRAAAGENNNLHVAPQGVRASSCATSARS